MSSPVARRTLDGGPNSLLARVRDRLVVSAATEASVGAGDPIGDRGPRGHRERPAAHGARAGLSHDAVVHALRAEGVMLGDEALLELAGAVLGEFDGFGRLEHLIRSVDVTDVLVNGIHGTWVDRGAGMERVDDLRFESEDHVRALAQRLADSVGRRLDQASPWVDAHLADGTRLHAVIPPLAVDGTLVSLRIPARRALDLAALQRAGSVTDVGAAWLRAVIDGRLSFLVTGGTGSGKTTVLGALLSEVAADQRIVIAEDSTELQPNHPHVVRLQSRTANVEGQGSVGLRDLVRQALRMRPDRIVVGEVRGAEVVDLLTAFNTGHEGCCGTVHANTAEGVPARLEALALTAGVPRAALHALVIAGLDVIVHLTRTRDIDGVHRRLIEGIHVVCPDRRHGLRVVEALSLSAMPARMSDAVHPVAGPGFRVLVDRLRLRGLALPDIPALQGEG